MELFVLAGVVVIEAVLFAFTNNVQKTTLYLGKKLAEGNEIASPARGFQDGITPRYQNYRNWASFTLIAVIAVLSYRIAWYWIPVSLLITLTLSIIVQKIFLPSSLSFYINIIFRDLANRSADYQKNGDLERADAAKTFGEMVGLVLAETVAEKTKISDLH